MKQSGDRVPMRVAVLGMGRMGQAIAVRLLDGGHDVVVWNRSPGKADAVVDKGAKEAHRLDEAVHGADVVITSLTDDDAVRQVALGADGLVALMDGDSIYADASTVSPALSDELAQRFPSFAAMPVAGTPETMTKGEAVCLVGGPAEVVDRLEPIASILSSVHHTYPAAHLATTAKLTTNLLLLAGMVTLAEGVALGRDGGLSDPEIRELLAESPNLPPSLRGRFDYVLSGSGPTWWTVALGAKDLRLALQLSTQELPVTDVVRQRYEEAARRGWADSDVAAVSQLYAE